MAHLRGRRKVRPSKVPRPVVGAERLAAPVALDVQSAGCCRARPRSLPRKLVDPRLDLRVEPEQALPLARVHRAGKRARHGPALGKQLVQGTVVLGVRAGTAHAG